MQRILLQSCSIETCLYIELTQLKLKYLLKNISLQYMQLKYMNIRTPLFLVFMSVFFTQVQAQILDYHTDVTITPEHKLITKVYYKIQVNNEDQRNIGEIKIHHSGKSKFKVKEAKISYNNEVVRKLKKKEFTTTNAHSSSTFYQDDLITRFKLHWDNYPYIIEYNYEEIEEDYLFIEYWSPYVKDDWTTKNAELSVHIPSSYKVNINADEGFKHEEHTNLNIKTLKWTYTDYKLPESEYFAPSFRSIIPFVKIVPDQFVYGVKGSTSSWKEYAKWVENLNADANDLPQSEKNKIDQLVKEAKNTDEKIEILYKYMQENTNYVNVDIDLGGFKSYPASYVCKNKYGDCKALTTYMKSMLNHAGIKAYYTLINTGLSKEQIDTKFPSQQFNHIILSIPTEKDTIFLENTSKHLPFNHLSTSNQAKYALFIDGENSKLIKTPAYKHLDNLEEKDYNFKLDKTGKGSLSFKSTVRGKYFEKFNYYKNANMTEDLQDAIESFLKVKQADLLIWKIEKEDHNTIALNVNTTVSKMAKKIGSLNVLQPPKISMNKIEKPTKRKLPFQFNLPYQDEHSFCYEVEEVSPDDYQLPKPISIKSRFGEYSYEVEKTDKGVCAHRVFKINKGVYSLADYKDFYTFYNGIRKKQNKTSIIYK